MAEKYPNNEEKIKQLKKAIEVGEESGFVSDFDAKAHLAELQKKHIH